MWLFEHFVVVTGASERGHLSGHFDVDIPGNIGD